MVREGVEKNLQIPKEQWKGPSEGLDYDVPKKAKNMFDSTDAIRYLREGDFYTWAGKDLSGDKDKGGFGLPADDVITTPEQNLLDPEETFTKLNTADTLKANSGFFDTSSKRREFRQWVRNYGDKNFKPTELPDYTGEAKSHYKTLEAWKKSWKSIKQLNKGMVCD
jgi:hypothetical protein